MDIADILKQHGQEHLLDFGGLSPEERAAYAAQLENIDWETVELWKG